MEQDKSRSMEMNSVDVNRLRHFLKKKRKFQAEQLGLPLSKHQCWDRRVSSVHDPPSNNHAEEKDFIAVITKGKTDGSERDDGSEAESAKDSNSFVEDTDSIMSVSDGTKTESGYAISSSYDFHCTSSADVGVRLKNSLYSLDSRSLRKSNDDREESRRIGGERNSSHNDSGLKTSLNFEEHLLEFGDHIDYGYSEYGHESEQCSDKELDNMIHTSEVNPNNYVLSSGRWSVNQEPQPDTKKLTIDKEFEQYFSMLMM